MTRLISTLIALTAVIGLARTASAQVCATSGFAYAQAAAPVYAAPVQAQAYVAAAPAYQATVVGVPLSDLGINYYFSVAADKREARIVEQVTAEVLARMNTGQYGILVPLQQQPAAVAPPVGNAATAPPVQPQPVPAPQPIPASPPPPTPQPPLAAPVPAAKSATPAPASAPAVTPTTPGLGSLSTTKLQALAIVQAKCIQCHKPGEIKGGVKLLNSDGSLHDADQEALSRMVDAVLRRDGVNPMPPTQSLTAEEKKVFLARLHESL